MESTQLPASSTPMPEASGDHAQKVARHYNQIEESGKDKRFESRIFFLRNFNNWIKSVLIKETLDKVFEKDKNRRVHVLDLCSGKGGDLLKWKKGRIEHLICADIAATSVEQSRTRYYQGLQKDARNHTSFSAEFIVADCTRERLKTKYENKKQQFDVVSNQFSFHYCFESYGQAMAMLRNACECLKVGGYFIGTTPNANDIVNRLRNSKDENSFGNDVFRISFPTSEKSKFPIFGSTYNFHLEGVVDCPEFLVYFPVVEKLAAEFGMKLVEKKTFSQYFKENVAKPYHSVLLENMQALEPYPGSDHRSLVSSDQKDYTFAEELVSRLTQDNPHGPKKTVGTLSQAEWEAATIYLVFVFQKVENISPEFPKEESTSLGNSSTIK